DISYHHFFIPEGFSIMDIGHFESEVDIVGVLFALLRKKFPNFVIHISENLNNSNPVFYL
ncbi:MAG: Nif3-like dinuclear metal center hexameric protein, partial [Bacteroidales bacterium]|nr:Nif3-like dinuclear metal center hexameric protein [Bacteroidales bacterium]